MTVREQKRLVATVFVVIGLALGSSDAAAQILDSDSDGLPDVVEQYLGTDAQNPDTDADGIRDGDEVRGAGAFTDPATADTDGDGFCDGLLAVDEICAPRDEALDPCGGLQPAPEDYVLSGSGAGCSGGGAPSGPAAVLALSALGLTYLARARRRRRRAPRFGGRDLRAKTVRPCRR